MSEPILTARLNHEERGVTRTDPGGALLAHTVHSPLAATPTAVPSVVGSAVGGDVFKVRSRERLTVYAEVPAGARGAMTELFVIPEVAFVDNPTDDQFFPLFEDEASDGALAAKAYESGTLSGSARIAFAFSMPAVGVFMRFKVYGTSADSASRATLYVTRHTNSL